MIVIADASPLNVLVRIGLVHILHDLFGHVAIPLAVYHELQHPHAPQMIRDWILNPPDWLTIQPPKVIAQNLDLDPGETEALSLAMELDSHLLLLDDLKARRVAQRLGLNIMGTLGVLELAARKNLLDLRASLGLLRQTDFAISDALLLAVLKRHKPDIGPKDQAKPE